MTELSDPIPAATLILMRESGGAAPEVLIVERAKTMAFAAGALVFPGGRIEPADHVAALAIAPELADGAARIAALRETIEETGLAPALTPSPDRAGAAALRAAVDAGEPFAALLERLGYTAALDALIPFARWCPNFKEARRFDTLFYLVDAPDGLVPQADQGETVHAFWARPADVLAEIAAGRAHAIFPTRRILERLAGFASIAAARADAARHPVRKITPWIEERGGARFLCIPEDAGYPITAEPLETARRH